MRSGADAAAVTPLATAAAAGRAIAKLMRTSVPLPGSLSISSVGAVPLRHAVDHREPEAGAALALGGEERLEAAAARVLVHADAGVVDFEHARSASGCRPRGAVRSVSVPPSRHRIDGVEDQVDERVADLALDRGDRRQVWPRVRVRTSMTTPRCCAMSLQRARVRSITCRTSLLRSTGASASLRLAQAIELAHARHGLRHVVDGALDDLELRCARVGLRFGSRSSNDSVYSATGEIALLMSCAMPLAIWPSARSRSCCMTCCCVCAQVVVGLLQRAVQLRLVRGQRDVLAHLAQELAFAAAECVGRAPRADQHAEHLAFHQQRRDDQRAQAGAREPLRKRELRLRDVRLVDQLPAHAARQAVLVDGDDRVLAHAEPGGQRLAARADAAHGEPVLAHVVQADAAEIHRQLVFDAARPPPGRCCAGPGARRSRA